MRLSRRFSLRMLFVVVTVLAMGLAILASYRRATLCYTQWIDPASSSAVKLFPAPQVKQQEDGRYGFTYYSQRRQAREYMLVAQPILRNEKKCNCRSSNETFEFAAPKKEAAEQCLSAIQKADVLAPGTFVIRGRVVDRHGRPLPSATIVVHGPADFYEPYHARSDGTITMPLASSREPAAPGSGYWFTVQARIRSDDFRRWTSSSFSLDPKHPEMVVVLTVPIDSRPEAP